MQLEDNLAYQEEAPKRKVTFGGGVRAKVVICLKGLQTILELQVLIKNETQIIS
jgi:hypothetical protein